MKSIVFCDGDMRYLPPYLSLMKTLEKLGEEPVFVGNDFWNNRSLLDSVGVRHRLVSIPNFGISFRQDPIKRAWQRAFPNQWRQVIRNCYWEAIDSVGMGRRDVVLWTLNTHSMITLGDRCLKYGKRHVHVCYELEEDLRSHRNLFDVDGFLSSSTFVQCEQNRADVMAAIYGLKDVPFVLPNRPYGQLQAKNLPIKDPNVSNVVSRWDGKFVFLYQGILGSDRIGITDLLAYLCEGFPDDIIAVQSHLNCLDIGSLRKYSNFVLVPSQVAPLHYAVTSRASVGLAYYVSNRDNCSPLNAVFCAPNKIYEYAQFGVPILGNNVPGLRYTIEYSGAGVCFKRLRKGEVIAAANTIKKNYDEYSYAAKQFFINEDITDRVQTILESVRA